MGGLKGTGERGGDGWCEVLKAAGEKRLSTGVGVTLGRKRDTSLSQAGGKEIGTGDVIAKREKGGKVRASLGLSFSVDWRSGCLLRVEGQAWGREGRTASVKSSLYEEQK